MRLSNRAGFTIIEVMVVAVIGALVLMTAYETLRTNQRAMSVQAAQVSSEQMMRTGVEFLFTELREVSGAGGDILAIDDDSIAVRVMRRFGLVCNVTYGSPNQILVRKVGNWFGAGDSLFVFADNDVSLSTDDAWLAGVAGSVDTTASCAGQPAQRINLSGMTAAMAIDSVRAGGPVRSYRRVTYGLRNYGNEPYLGQMEPGQWFVPLVGPLTDYGTGLDFDYFDANGAPTINPANVARIDLTLRTQSHVLTPNGTPVRDSVHATIFARN